MSERDYTAFNPRVILCSLTPDQLMGQTEELAIIEYKKLIAIIRNAEARLTDYRNQLSDLIRNGVDKNDPEYIRLNKKTEECVRDFDKADALLRELSRSQTISTIIERERKKRSEIDKIQNEIIIAEYRENVIKEQELMLARIRERRKKGEIKIARSVVTCGDSVDLAIYSALCKLNISKSQADIVVLDNGKKGFFGIGKRQAKVKVSIK